MLCSEFWWPMVLARRCQHIAAILGTSAWETSSYLDNSLINRLAHSAGPIEEVLINAQDFYKRFFLISKKIGHPAGYLTGHSGRIIWPDVPAGYPARYPAGYPTGYPAGYPVGYPVGYSEGYPAGYPMGYPIGYPSRSNL